MLSTRLFLYQLINQKKISWLIISIATICKSLLVAIFSNFEGDKSFYLLLAKNLSEGKGFTIPFTVLNNPGITENIYNSSALSPLYSIIAAPLLKIFPANYFFVTWLIESLSWLLFFIVLHKLLFRLTQNHFWTNFFILFSGFFHYNIEFSSAPKDVLAVAFLFAALLRCINVAHSSSHTSFIYLAGTSILFFVPGFIKYTYLPLGTAFTLSLLFIGYLKKDKPLLRHGVVILLFYGILVAVHYFYFLSLARQTIDLYTHLHYQQWSLVRSGNEFSSGFFPENLLQMYPFIPASVFNLDLLGVQIKTHLSTLYYIYAKILFAISFTGIAAFVAGFLYVAKKYYRKFISHRVFFLLTGMFISIALVALLSFMSVRYLSIVYKGGISKWTYVYESRQFLFPIVFLQLCMFAFLFAKKQTVAFLYWLRVFFLIIIAIGFLHGVYFMSKQIINLPSVKKRPMSLNKLITYEADSIEKTLPGYTVWLATEIPHLNWYAKLHTQKVLNNLTFLNDSSFRLSPKTILLTAITKEDTFYISKYLRRSDVKLYRNYNNIYFLFCQKVL